jgi:hypothetical protein
MSGDGSSGELNPYTKTSVFEKLSLLVSEIENSIRNEDGGSNGQVESQLSEIRSRSYLERAPEAQHATLLFRHYSNLVSRRTGGQPNAGFGFWDHDLSRHIPPTAFEGTAEVLVGMEATRSNAFILRSIISSFSFVAFVVLCSCKYMHVPTLTAYELFTSDCYMREASYQPYAGSFNMVPYQWLIAVSFFVFFNSLGFCVFYLLPQDPNTKQKFIPGCGDMMERCLHKVGREDVRHGARTATQRISDFCNNHSKQLEWSADGVLLILTVVLCIIVSIDVGKGAEFTFGAHPPQWYTLSTFMSTFQAVSPLCVDGGNPSTYISWGLTMLYISAFFQVLSLKVSRDSYLKFQKGKEPENVTASGHQPLNSENMDRRGLMRSTDVDDEEVRVDL